MLYRAHALRFYSGIITLSLVVSFGFLNKAHADIQINHNEIGNANPGQRIDVNSGVRDDGTDIKRVRAYFKADGEQRWHFAPLRNAGGGKVYTGLLPAPDIHTKKVDYRLMAVNSKNQTAKTEVFTIHIDADKEALARLQQKPPTDIKIDVSDIQEIRDQYRSINSHAKITRADRLGEVRRHTEPSPDSRVEVRSEYRPDVIDVPGFMDYIDLYFIGPAEAFGVTAGIVDPAMSVAGVSGAAATADSVAAAAGGVAGKAASGTGGSSAGSTAAGASAKSAASTGVLGTGIGWGPILGGIAVAGGVVAASSSSSSDDSGGGGGGGGGSVSNFAGSWSGPACPTGPNRYVVTLSQSGSDVSGNISFHKCPDEGRAGYSVSGTATSSPTLQLSGTRVSGQGPLGGTAPGSQTFSITNGGAPNPRLD